MFLIRSVTGYSGRAAIATLAIFMSAPAWATNVLFETTLGAVEVELFDDAARGPPPVDPQSLTLAPWRNG